MATRITALDVRDVRFPTSRQLDGSDAMNPDPDYSACYVILRTDDPRGLKGHGLTFTIGRGNDICVAAVRVLEPYVVGRSLEEIAGDMGAFYRLLTGDSQLRWLGPEKGVIHLATSAVLNAAWDLWAKAEGKPLWKLLADLSPEQLVRCVDFRYITDALTPERAVDLLEQNREGRAEREAWVREQGYPAYTTAAGWLGYSDEKLRALALRGIEQGFTHFKMKVGRDLQDDVRRLHAIRAAIGNHRTLMVDANQVWEVGQAIDWMRELAEFKPMWIEEPTSPDDVLGHQAIARALNPLGIGVATGEHCQNRILFKQFMAAGAMQFVQADAGRLGGVNECLAVWLLARRFDLPVCPHAGGVGLCEMVQHLSIWDYVACSGTTQGRVVEYVDHLHEHFVDPVRIVDGRYACPTAPGYSTEMFQASLADYEFPNGKAWRS
ncbi:MAG TPA: L-fuconate dehydratase [Humisphaera sp.]